MGNWLERLDAALVRKKSPDLPEREPSKPSKRAFEPFDGTPPKGFADFFGEVCAACGHFAGSAINPSGGLGLCAIRKHLRIAAASACEQFERGKPAQGGG